MEKSTIKITLVSLLLFLLVVFVALNTKVSFKTSSVFKYKIPSEIFRVRMYNYSKKENSKNVKIEKVKFSPEVSEDEVIIKTSYASLSYVDYMKQLSLRDDESFFPCTDFSGTIVKKGSNVSDFELGDNVLGYINTSLGKNGACSQYIKINKDNIVHKPFSLTEKQAAAIPSAALFADFIFNEAKLNKNSKVFMDEAITENASILISFLNYNGINPVTVDDDDFSSWLNKKATLIMLEKWKKEKVNHVKKYDLVIDFNDGMKTQDLYSLVKKGGYYIVENSSKIEEVKNLRKDINVVDVSGKKNIVSIKEIGELIDDGKVEVRTNKVFHFRKFREAFARSQKPSLKGKTLISFID